MDLLTDFKAYLMTEKRASVNTIASYLRDVTQFLDYLDGESRQVLDVNRDAIETYMHRLIDRGKSAATVTRALASLKCLYRWLQQIGQCDHNPTKEVKAEKVERKLPQILSNKEVELLLAQPRCVDPKGYRDHAMLEVLYATGIRVSELISLDIENVNLSGCFIVCTGKGKSRIIPLYQGAVKALSDYIKNVRPGLVAEGETALFVNMNGERMSRQGFWKIIKQYGNKAEIEMEITPHVLRHTFATHLINNGAALKSVQVMLGHSDVSTTHMYLNAENRQIREAYDRAHPKA